MRKKEILIKLICIISIILTFIISNISNANDIRWDLYFENIEITEGSIVANQDATIIGPSRAEITFDVTLEVPGDFYEFTVDAVNNGTVDAMIDQIGINRLTDTQKKYMTYEVTYSDGARVKVNDKLSAGTTEKLRVRVAFKEDTNPDDLPTATGASMTLTLNTSYVQADENAVERERNTVNNSNTINNTNTINSTNTANTNSFVNNNSNNDTNNTNLANTIYNSNDSSNKTVGTNSNNGENGNSNDNNANNLINAQNNKSTTKIIQKIKSIATGDEILKYVIILVLAIFALVLSFKKNIH